MLSTPANALPIASPIPDATGATAAVVIAGVVHMISLIPTQETIGNFQSACQAGGSFPAADSARSRSADEDGRIAAEAEAAHGQILRLP